MPNISSFHRRLIEHFNSRYELHGRRLRLVEVPLPGDPHSAQGQRTAAVAAGERGVFAALEIGGTVIDSTTYRAELARLGVIAVFDGVTPTSTEAQLVELAPYLWSYHPPFDRLVRNLGEFACASLAGRPAEHSGTETGKTRKFGMIHRRPAQGSLAPAIAALRTALARCGEDIQVAEVAWDDADDAGSSQRAAVALADLRSRGVTTVVYLGQETSGTGNNSLRVASAIGYQPEWLIAGTTWLANENFAQRSFPAEQRSHVFGVVPWNKTNPASDEPAFNALREVDPSAPASSSYQPDLLSAYHSLLILASGIQGAGSRLTAESFSTALRGTAFANPGSGSHPLFQAAVRPRAGTFLDDFAVVWWSEAAPQLRGNFNGADGVGGYCWLGRGQRWAEGRWPARRVSLFSPATETCR